MFKHFFTKSSQKELDHLTPSEAEKVFEKIKTLNSFPYNSYRIRVGKIRIIFEIDQREKIIVIRKIGYRGNAYSDL